MPRKAHALAMRSGQPYPVPFQFFLTLRHDDFSGLSFSVAERLSYVGESLRDSQHDQFIAVDCRGIEPRFPGCKPSVVPLDQQPSSSGFGSRTRDTGLMKPR